MFIVYDRPDFEHVSLPRHVVDPDNQRFDSAEPGEKHLPTKLYNPCCTPHRQLGDWGIGFGLYFTALRALGILTFVAGLISLPNIIYFGGDDYSDGQDDVRFVIRGSAICTNESWVPCPSCTLNDFPDGRVGTGVNQNTGENTTFALRNFCDGATIEQGFVNLAVLVVIVLGLLAMNITAKRMEIRFDEDEQTAQDYTVVVTNPPPDAYDPEEWRNFFYDNIEGASVTACTVGVANDLLVSSLVERREKLKRIELKVEPGTSLDTLTLSSLAAQEERKRRVFGRMIAGLSPSIPELVARVVVLTSKVQGLAQQAAPVSNVFLTFETEADQRRVLDALLNGDTAKSSKPLFRDEYALQVKEPDEPSTIRWQDLNVTMKDKLKQRTITALTCILTIMVVIFLIRIVNGVNVTFSAFAVSFFNVVFPRFAMALTNFESHDSEGNPDKNILVDAPLFHSSFWSGLNPPLLFVSCLVVMRLTRNKTGELGCVGCEFPCPLGTSKVLPLLFGAFIVSLSFATAFPPFSCILVLFLPSSFPLLILSLFDCCFCVFWLSRGICLPTTCPVAVNRDHSTSKLLCFDGSIRPWS